MKKSYKIILIALIILLVAGMSFVLKIDMGKTQDEIIDVLRQELHLSEDDGTMISCVGEYEIGESALLWFYFENQPLTYYRAVECRVVADGKYQVKEIYKPMTYAQDIVHVIWRADDVFLINNPACRSIVYKDKNGDVISETLIVSSDIPYVFFKKSYSESTCDFVDSLGNVIH